MPEVLTKPFTLQGAPRAELARLCRQICLAREQRSLSPVTAEDEFIAALTTVRATYGPASVDENDLKEIVALEESRVADAAVLAELIASRISTTHPFAQPLSNSPAQQKSSPPASVPSKVSAPQPALATPSLNIADLIDGMLMQEKRDPRTSGHH
ncbi:MAG: hypothetical protein QM790_06775 [Nibricoccus sp.]